MSLLLTLQEVHLVFAVVMAIITVGFAGILLRLPAGHRRYHVLLVVLPAVTAVGLWLVSQNILIAIGPNGEVVPLPRMFMYAVFYPTLMAYIGLAGGIHRRGIATIIVLILLVIGGVTFSWLVPEPIGPLGVIVMLLSLGATAYLLFGPYARIAAEQTGERTLLYGKLRNLLFLLWTMMVIGGLAAPQSLGLLDIFVSTLFGSYIDLVAICGFGLIVLRARETVERMFDETALDEIDYSAESVAPSD